MTIHHSRESEAVTCIYSHRRRVEPDTFQLHPKIGDPVNSAAHSHAPAPHCTDATRPIQNDVDPTCGHLREGELVPVGSVSDRFARGFERDDLPAPPTCVLPTERDKFVRHAGTGSRDGSAVRRFSSRTARGRTPGTASGPKCPEAVQGRQLLGAWHRRCGARP